MFSGIIEDMAIVSAIEKDKDNVNYTFRCSFANELKIDQSVSHNGVCLTVVNLDNDVVYCYSHEGDIGAFKSWLVICW